MLKLYYRTDHYATVNDDDMALYCELTEHAIHATIKRLESGDGWATHLDSNLKFITNLPTPFVWDTFVKKNPELFI